MFSKGKNQVQDTRKAFRRIPPARLSLLMAILLLLALGATALVFAASGRTESIIVAGTPEKPAAADKDILRRLEQGGFLTAARKTVPEGGIINNSFAQIQSGIHAVNSDYFYVWDIPLVSGGFLTDQGGGLQRAVCLNKQAAYDLFGGYYGIEGDYVQYNGQNYAVAGVVEDGKEEPAAYFTLEALQLAPDVIAAKTHGAYGVTEDYILTRFSALGLVAEGNYSSSRHYLDLPATAFKFALCILLLLLDVVGIYILYLRIKKEIAKVVAGLRRVYFVTLLTESPWIFAGLGASAILGAALLWGAIGILRQLLSYCLIYYPVVKGLMQSGVYHSFREFDAMVKPCMASLAMLLLYTTAVALFMGDTFLSGKRGGNWGFAKTDIASKNFETAIADEIKVF